MTWRGAWLDRVVPIAAVLLGTGLARADGQAISAWDGIAPGPSPVGFATSTLIDPTRVSSDGEPRQLLLSVWYPAEAGGTAMHFIDYARRYGAGPATDAELARHFREGFAPDVAVPLIERLMASPVLAQGGAPNRPGPYPLVLYAPGAGATLLTHVVTCEFLASYGFVVAGLAATGADGFGQTFDLEGQTAQQRDLALAVASLRQIAWVDSSRIALIGFSFGANAALLLGMRDPRIRALVSLDGAETFGNGTPMLRAAPDLSPLALGAALLRIEAWPDPHQDSTVVAALAASPQVIVRMPGADHHDFISRGVLLAVANQEQTVEARARYLLTLDLVRTFLDDRMSVPGAFQPERLVQRYALAAARVLRRPAHAPRITREQLVAWLGEPGGAGRVDSLQRRAGSTPILSAGTYQLVAARVAEQGRPDLAGDVLDLALRSFPRDGTLHAVRGNLWLETGDLRRAARAFETALTLDPTNLYALEGKAALAARSAR
jgi:dienelactone hydrolase